MRRERPLAQLHAAIGNGLTVIQAPAGSGKTALAMQFADELDFSLAWLALDAGCASPEVFAERLARVLAGPAFPPPVTAARLSDLFSYLGNALQERIEASEQPLLVVLDNVQEMGPEGDATAMLEWLVRAMPEDAELLLCSRDPFQAPTVNRRLVSGEAAHLGKEALAFTLDEVRGLIELRGSQADADTVLEASSGWAMGVLALLAGSARAASGLGDAWRSYLTQELWGPLAPDLRALLMPLGLRETVSRELAVELLGAEGWTRARRWLNDNDFLVEALDENGVRLNPLLREFLRREFATGDPAGFHARAAVAIRHAEEAGALADAVELVHAFEDGDGAARIIETHGAQLLQEGRFRLLERAFTGVPRAMVVARPRLRALRVRLLAHLGQHDEAVKEADEVIADLGTPHGARVIALVGKARSFRMQLRIPEMRATLDEAHRIGIDDPAIRAEVAYAEADIELSGMSNYPRAEELLREAIMCASSQRMESLELLARSTLGQLMAMRGDGPAAVLTLQKAADGWAAHRGTANLGWVLNNLGMAYLSVGEYEQAIPVLERAITEGQRCRNERNEAYATASLAEAEASLGRFEDARTHWERSIAICSEAVNDATLAGLSIAGLAGTLLGLGELERADYFVRQALLVAEDMGSPYELATVYAQQAAIASANGKHGEAITAARDAIALFKKAGASEVLLAANYRLALCFFRADRRRDAEPALKKVAALITEPWRAAHLRPLVTEHPMFAQWAASQGVLPPAFKDLVGRVTFRAGDDAEATAPGLPAVEVESLGTLRVRVDGHEVDTQAWESRTALELFFVFLAHKGGMRKEEAVELLYPELPRDKCNSTFHSNVYRVRRALYPESIVKTNGAYRLNPDGRWDWDVEQFEGQLAKAMDLPAGSNERAELFKAALELYRGPFAGPFLSEWSESLRRDTEERSHHALALLAGHHAAKANYEAAAECLERLLRMDRLNEDAAFELAACRARAGQRTIALETIDAFARLHQQELGEPAPARFERLRQTIAAG
ncbi:MAG: tetratricopeptide repeat protein [Dehalococcoidia bacterium]|nr:tetratricopeptide repeat protein [Dehalococcoidia bacterium]